MLLYVIIIYKLSSYYSFKQLNNFLKNCSEIPPLVASIYAMLIIWQIECFNILRKYIYGKVFPGNKNISYTM